MSQRKRYTKEFKQEAIRLLESGSKPAAVLGRELGVARNQLYKWQEQLQSKGNGAFPGRGRHTPAEVELARLQCENEWLKEENEILKKAAQYFARESS